MIDLHTHTTASDGLLSPADLVHAAAQRGVSILGVTDHDTLDGLEEAIAAAQETGITVIPGVELSTTIPGPEIHILGYFVDLADPLFRERLASLSRDRIRRIELVVSQLNQAGYPVELASLLADAEVGSIGRPHVARALISLGAASDMDDAFRRFLRRGTVGWAPRMPFTAEEAVSMIRENGALPVLAHPFSTGDPAGLAARLVPAGLRGFEVFYGEYSLKERAELQSIADAYELVPTGGSDYHGPRFREGRDLGTVDIPEWVWPRLKAAHAA